MVKTEILNVVANIISNKKGITSDRMATKCMKYQEVLSSFYINDEKGNVPEYREKVIFPKPYLLSSYIQYSS